MELMQQAKGYSDSREEEEDEEAAAGAGRAEAEMITIPREESSSKHLYSFSSPYATNYTTRLHHQDAASNNLMNNQRKQLELMDLSLGRNKNDEANYQQQGSGGGGCSSTTNNNEGSVEKEHMFDKVVTPSDVGKLNRLVIPKQHAEKYFPLDSSSNEKGLLLNFEDRNGKLWRFRYSYWNSSQSYVMTKGWSRFVKDKKLDSGDIVSFQRGIGDLYRHRLYIDWKRRPDHVHAHAHTHANVDPSPTFISPLFLPNQYSAISWGGRFYSLPSPPASTSTMPPPRHHDHFHHHRHLNYSHMYTFQQQRLQDHQQYYGDGANGGSGSSGNHPIIHNNYTELNSGSDSVYYLRSTPSMSMQQMGDQNLRGQHQERGDIAPMIIDSVPVAHHHHLPHHGGMDTGTSNAGKRLRLFGVNMECASSPEEDSKCLSSSATASHVTRANSFPSSSLPPLRVLPHEDPLSSSTSFGDIQRGGTTSTSVLFDLDPSLQYRQ